MSVNVKLGNDTITGVSSVKLENATTPGTYETFNLNGITPEGNQDIETLNEYNVSAKATARVSAAERAKIIPENIITGATILGVSGSATVPSGNQDIETLNEYNVTTKATARISAAERAKIVPSNITSGTTILGVAGSAVVPIGNQDIATLDEYNVAGKATARISAAERTKIIPANIKNGETILGVTGTYSGGTISINGATNVTVKAMDNLVSGDTIRIVSGMVPEETPTALPDSAGKGCAFNYNGTRLALASFGYPYLTIYDTTTTPYSKLSSLTTTPSYCNACAWSPDGTRLAVAHNGSPYITIYDTTTTPYTKLTDPDVLPAGTSYACAWNPDGTRLAVSASSLLAPVVIYNTTTTPYTKIADPAPLPTSYSYGCAWNPAGTRLALATYNSYPYLTVYDTTTTPYSKLANLDTPPTGTVYGCAWNPDGTRLAVSHNTLPYLTVYDTTTTQYRKLTNPTTLPTGQGNSCAWNYDGTRLAIALNTSPYVMTYIVVTGTPLAYAANNIASRSAESYGIITENISTGNTGQVLKIFTVT